MEQRNVRLFCLRISRCEWPYGQSLKRVHSSAAGKLSVSVLKQKSHMLFCAFCCVAHRQPGDGPGMYSGGCHRQHAVQPAPIWTRSARERPAGSALHAADCTPGMARVCGCESRRCAGVSPAGVRVCCKPQKSTHRAHKESTRIREVCRSAGLQQTSKSARRAHESEVCGCWWKGTAPYYSCLVTVCASFAAAGRDMMDQGETCWIRCMVYQMHAEDEAWCMVGQMHAEDEAWCVVDQMHAEDEAWCMVGQMHAKGKAWYIRCLLDEMHALDKM
eukprot:1152605-Pelagomonas_calceolata.AAC.4